MRRGGGGFIADVERVLKGTRVGSENCGLQHGSIHRQAGRVPPKQKNPNAFLYDSRHREKKLERVENVEDLETL
jgi:hypothetical protein